MIGQRYAHRPRMLQIGEQAEKPAERLTDGVVTRPRRIRTVAAEARDRAPHQARIVARNRVVAEPEPLHRADAEIFDQDVGGADERTGRGHALGALEIEHHALLVAIDRAEGRAVLDPAPAAERIAAVGRFHLDHLRAEIAKQHSGVRTGNIIGEFNHADAVERRCHVSLDRNANTNREIRANNRGYCEAVAQTPTDAATSVSVSMSWSRTAPISSVTFLIPRSSHHAARSSMIVISAVGLRNAA